MNEFSIALLGDGVIARWGENCPELFTELARLYSQSTFRIDNYGRDNSRIGHALWRVSNDLDGRKSLSYINPGVVIVESCAYTQFWDGPEGLSEYRDILRRIWDEITRTTTARLLFCLAAAPPRDRFLEGWPEFTNTSKAARGRFADGVKMYLDEARHIADDEGWPLADVDDDLTKVVKEGESARRYFDQSDTFYPSRLGYTLMAKVVVRQMDNQRFVEERLKK